MIHPHDVTTRDEPWTVRIVELARALQAQGHQVRLVYCPLAWERRLGVRRVGGVPAVPLTRRVGVGRRLGAIATVTRLAAWADVVHVQKCYHYVCLPALWAAWWHRLPLHYDWDDWEVQIYHASDGPSVATGWFLALWERTMLALADSVSVASRRLAALAVHWGRDRRHLALASVAADLEQFRPGVSGARVRAGYGDGAPVVLYLGQLHGAQYAHLFVRAARELLAQGVRARFLIVGGGYEAPRLRALADTLGVNGQLVVTGMVPHGEIPEYLAAADVVVACFERNAVTRCKSPLKIAEYLAAGKAIVASRVGEVGRMVGPAAVLVRPGDASALAEGIRRVLSDPVARRHLERLARARAEALGGWRQTARRLAGLYRRGVDRSAGARS